MPSSHTRPLVLSHSDTPPSVRVPETLAEVVDKRGRFREIFRAVLEAHGPALPDYRPCGEALSRIGEEPPETGRPVDLGPSKRDIIAAVVPGIGYACFKRWLEPPGTAAKHVRKYGFDQVVIEVDPLSSSTNNARQIRDALMAMPAEGGAPRIVLIGYSKGAPDILEAIVNYPEIRSRVAAVVSAAGAVGGSPLANDAKQYQADLLRHFPGAIATADDHGGVASLRPSVRRTWLAENPLPAELRYYSAITLPERQRISRVLRRSYRKLSIIDSRNDSQMIFSDEVIPGSTLMGYLNADHWAIAVPIARKHKTIASLFATQNAYPREALLEAMLRFIEEDLDRNAS